MNSVTPTISVICPIHDEEDALSELFAELIPLLEASGERYEILCVNDGSRDGSLAALQTYQQDHREIRIIDLTRNFGKEAALTCGLDHARGQAVIPIDADLQDPPELILDMIRVWRQGFDVVLAQRTDRGTDSLLKRKTAEWFYRLHNLISDPPIPPNVGDFRLLDRKVVDALRQLPERRRFMKGLFAWVGFRQATIPYARRPRSAGRSKFSGWRLWNLALEGITSFSTAPLRIWSYLGLCIALLSFIFGLFIAGRTILVGRDLPGYASMITVVLFLGGIQLIGLGILGEYIGRIFNETKGRPVYIIRQRSDDAA